MSTPGAAANSGVTFDAIADDAWLVRVGESIDASTNARVHALATCIRKQQPAWLRDLVPAYASLGVFFDSTLIAADAVREWLHAQAGSKDTFSKPSNGRVVDIPVVYGGDFGPDLDSAAAESGLSIEEFVRRHAGGDYTVAMIGFAPGFPYLLGLDPAIALARLATPRAMVPAGSVGIGGAQTGIYPCESPGGWRLIGRTPLVLFDAGREPPALLAPGDRVRFHAIDSDEFARLSASP